MGLCLSSLWGNAPDDHPLLFLVDIFDTRSSRALDLIPFKVHLRRGWGAERTQWEHGFECSRFAVGKNPFKKYL